MNDARARAASAQPLTLRLFQPPPDASLLKLDWRSPTGRTGVLLEWDSATPTVEDGLPPDVARVVATALCSVATVTGCTVHVPDELGSVWAPVADGYARRFPRWSWRPPRHLGVLATRHPGRVVRFFDEEYLDWSQECQALVLSRPGTLPELDRRLMEACLARPLAVTPEQLLAAGVTGLVLPGVDGDMAGLYLLDAEARQELVRALAAATRAAAGRWEELDGSTHRSTLAAAAGRASVRR